MKTPSIFGVSVGMLLQAVLAAHCQYRPGGHGMDEVMRRQVPQPQGVTATDGYLIALAEAGKTNFIADATHLPTDTSVIQGKAQNSLGNVLLELAHQRNLSWMRYDPDLFLFWDAPDLVQLQHDVAIQDIRLMPPAAVDMTEWDAFHAANNSKPHRLTPPISCAPAISLIKPANSCKNFFACNGVGLEHSVCRFSCQMAENGTVDRPPAVAQRSRPLKACLQVLAGTATLVQVLAHAAQPKSIWRLIRKYRCR